MPKVFLVFDKANKNSDTKIVFLIRHPATTEITSDLQTLMKMRFAEKLRSYNSNEISTVLKPTLKCEHFYLRENEKRTLIILKRLEIVYMLVYILTATQNIE